DNGTVITEIMNNWLASRTTAQAMAELESARIPAGPVMPATQVMDDPQVKARKLLQPIDYPGAPKPVPLASPAVQLSSTPPSIRMRAPMLGEHTDEVIREIGFSDEEIAAFRSNRVV